MSEPSGPARVLEDATYVIFMGEVMPGRPEIEGTHHDVFTKWQKGASMLVEPLRTTMPGDEVAVVLTRGGIGHGHVTFDELQTFTLNTEMSEHAKRRYTGQAPAGDA